MISSFVALSAVLAHVRATSLARRENNHDLAAGAIDDDEFAALQLPSYSFQQEPTLQKLPAALIQQGGVPQDATSRIPELLKKESDRCSGSWKADVRTPRLTTQEELEEPVAKELIGRFKEAPVMHRKQWEYIFLLKILDTLPNVHRALGFAVGEEPTVSYLASKNISVTATDLPPSADAASDWHDTNQLMLSASQMNQRHIARDEQMSKFVSQEYIDMNKVEDSKAWKKSGTWDLVWSICSVEHTGSIRKALDFMDKSLSLLGTGGTLVHTTEFNIASLDDTVTTGGTVLFRKKDVDAFYTCAKAKGYEMSQPCFDVSTGAIDREYDTPPYSHDRHLRLEIDKFISTCVGMVVRKPVNWTSTDYDCGGLFDDLGIVDT